MDVLLFFMSLLLLWHSSFGRPPNVLFLVRHTGKARPVPYSDTGAGIQLVTSCYTLMSASAGMTDYGEFIFLAYMTPTMNLPK